MLDPFQGFQLGLGGDQDTMPASRQGCESGSELDPDSIGSVDPDPGLAKKTHKSRKFLKSSCFKMLDGLS